MLLEARQQFEETPQIKEAELLFTDFMLQWLEMMKHQIELTTYASYSRAVKNRIVPHFKEKEILLKDLQPKHIQEFYQYELKTRGVKPNTVIRIHANVRKALQYAFKTGLISSNPADKIERPKKNTFIASFYDSEEIKVLVETIKGDPIELAVQLAAFYGLRRSEVVGLKWDAIDFKNKSISIQHTVISVSVEGQYITVAKDRTKNKASRRTLPLIPAFESLLLQLKAQQENNQIQYHSSYCTEYTDYIYLDKLGQRIKPGYITQHFPFMLEKFGLRRIRFHDLRHSCASLLLANGVGMKEIQEWLGHSDFSTTANIYAHLDYSSKVSSAQAMNNCLQLDELL
ncbi:MULTISPECIES: tyrosine-type recombinase/integrase [Paenibacillus]|jgi:integrase|uniref:tyrosine-type recombinase/integrase n=1 Tax=Paenibacillus TaxID=44249 RepID=UPI000B00EEB6|nr:site-specific integrase [Paenibacillus polymyxa]VUG03787.1 Tyrosine recombinase XerC [Paenibacillus polymyxa]